MKKILVIGASGAGKSTLAKRLSEMMDLPFFPSDGFYWESGWRVASPERVRQQVGEVVLRDAWILDGNFDDEHEFVWKQADCIVWLDYPLMTILKQVAARNLRWTVTRQLIWSGNRMTLRRVISGIRHTVKTYSVKKENYPCWLGGLGGVKVIRLHSRKETDNWLENLMAE